jgi:hypothetical protein
MGKREKRVYLERIASENGKKRHLHHLQLRTMRASGRVGCH